MTGSSSTQLEADTVLIATGSHPHHPDEFPFYDARVYDSDTILHLREIPQSMLIAGGGVIGCEYACLFSALGVKTMLVEGRDRLLSFLDAELSKQLAASMRAMGVDFFMPDVLESIEPADEFIEVRFKSGNKVAVQTILAATGRTGNTAGMNLESVGIIPGKRGGIDVNEHYQTCVPHIYAVGDVIGFPALASTSMEQARVAMVYAFDLKYKSDVAHILPYGIYTIPEASMAGDTEESLVKSGVPYVVGRTRYSHNARGQIIGDKDGFLKLIFREEDMRLLGVHIIGEQASELIHIGLNALITQGTADIFIQTCFNYPTLSEMYKYATYDALGARAKRRAATATAG